MTSDVYVRKALNRVCRRATASWRVLPDFLILGTQKGGTSSLFEYLCEHPSILGSYKKEVHFFDGGVVPGVDAYAKGPRWYRSHFPLEFAMQADRIVGEASPAYLFSPLAPQRIHQHLPGAKLIVLLRNPTDRALSHFFHNKRRGWDTVSMRVAFQEEETRLRNATQTPNLAGGYLAYSYKARGRYAEQLERYFQYFPRTQLLILQSEVFFKKPRLTLQKVYQFLNVDDTYVNTNIQPRNVGTNKRLAPIMLDYLNNYFIPYNRQLSHLIGATYEW